MSPSLRLNMKKLTNLKFEASRLILSTHESGVKKMSL